MGSGLAAVAGAVILALSPFQALAEYPRLRVRYDNVVGIDGLDRFLEDLRRVVVERKLPALRPLTGESFFWDQDFGGAFSKNDSPLTNLIAALSLDDKLLAPEYRGSGWVRFATIVQSGTTMAHPKRRSTVCTPGKPVHLDPKLLHQARRATQTDADDITAWGFVADREVPVRLERKPTATLVGALRSEAVRVIEWSPGWVRVALPDGRRGFVFAGDIHSASPERLCFQRGKDGAWKITGYMGGGD